MKTLQEYSNIIWTIGDSLLRNRFNKAKWDEIFLPFILLRRLDCLVLSKYTGSEEGKKSVQERYKAGTFTKDQVYNNIAKNPIYIKKGFANTWLDVNRLEAGGGLAWIVNHSKDIKGDLLAYVNGFPSEVQSILASLGLFSTEKATGAIEQLDGNSADAGFDVLKSFVSEIVQHFDIIDMPPDMMGNLFEELIRQFNEAKKTDAGEHYTPRDAIQLLILLLLNGDLPEDGESIDFYDPTCGTGGILFVGEQELRNRCKQSKRQVYVNLYGQEVNPFTHGICQADLLLQERDFRNVKRGDTLAEDKHEAKKFRYQGANPPYGVKWGGKELKELENKIRTEIAKGEAGRFPAGAPKTTEEGQLLFLQHMVSKMRPVNEGGGRLAIVMNGNPLFAADAGQGDSEIRRYLLEHDLVEAIVALPRDMFFNTGIATYIWVLTNKKDNGKAYSKKRVGHVQLIDASQMGARLPKGIGSKRYELTPVTTKKISEWHRTVAGEDVAPQCKIVPNSYFGYYSVKIAAQEVRGEQLGWKIKYKLAKLQDGKPVLKKGKPVLEPKETVGHAWKAFSESDAKDIIVEMEKIDSWDILGCEVEPYVITDTERVPMLPLFQQFPNPTEVQRDEYLKKAITNLRPEGFPDFTIEQVTIGYEIPFTQIFYKYEKPEDPEVLKKRLAKLLKGLEDML